MAYFTLNTVTIPTPEPYDKSDATRNTENFYYAMLQVLQRMRTAGFIIPDSTEITRLIQELQTLNTNLTNIKTAIDNISLTVNPTDLTALVQAVESLQFNDQELDFGFLQVFLRGCVRDQ